MNTQFREILDQAWIQITRFLFCEQINLIYDYLATLDDKRFDFLPLPEEIQRAFPNRRGYSTGMEDSMINGGTTLDICILRAKLFPETEEECRTFSKKLLKGMELCATVHGRNGYIVRSVSHRDGTSCYPASSRDQMTFWVWGLWRYYCSSFATPEEQKRIRELVVMLAERGESEVIPENDYSILTLDGVPDPLNKMDRVGPHEVLRLPMFYRVAFELTGALHWKASYERCIEDTLQKAAVQREYWNHFESSQFLLTLSLCHQLDPRPEFLSIAKWIAAVAQQQLNREFLPQLEQWTGSWSCPAVTWRDSQNISLMKQKNGDVIGLDGRLDLRFSQTPEFEKLLDLVRIPGNLMTGLLLAPGYSLPPELLIRFCRAFQRPDYSRTYSCSVVSMLHAVLLLLERLEKMKDFS